MPPVLGLVLGTLAMSLPLVAIAFWYWREPKSSQDWLDDQSTPDRRGHRGQVYLFVAILSTLAFTWGLDRVLSAWADLYP